MFSRAFFLCALLLLALPARAQVSGTVTIKGPPNSHDDQFFARSSGCGESPIRHTENWKVGSKGELAEVVVWVVEPKIPATPMSYSRFEIGPESIAQKSCRYEPHVAVEMAGVPFKIINMDPTLHNIRAKVYDPVAQAAGADVFNFGQSYQGQTDEQQFDTPGIYTLQCDVHAWMQAWVRVFPHRDDNFRFFTVTDKDGAFSLPDGRFLEDGDYKIDAWHPKFAAPMEMTVHVKGGVGTVAFQFDGTKSF